MEKDNHTKKLPGFYIALCCCVIAIGVAGFIIQGNTSQTADTPTEAEETFMPELAYNEDLSSDTAYEDNASDTTEIMDVTEPIPTEPPVLDYAYDNPDVVSAAVIVNAEESCDFIDPLPEMTVRFGLCTDTLMYNECYGDWRTHNGIDIDAPIGCSVNATAPGTVTKVTKGSYGNTVTIEHSNGFKSVYAQLGDVNVKEGDNVEQSSVIGTVGESMGENLKDSHLHYELYKDGKAVNPEEY